MLIDIDKGIKGELETTVEPERQRIRRLHRLGCSARKSQREHRLDRFFSHHPPNGTVASIFRAVSIYFHSPNWLDWPYCIDSINRLEQKYILTITRSTDKLGVMSFVSTTNAKQRIMRDNRTDEIIKQFQADIGDDLNMPLLEFNPAGDSIHYCVQVSADKWRVRLFIGGRIRLLGTYRYETAIRLQDALTCHFQQYRSVHNYNICEDFARRIIETTPVLKQFLTDLESHWKSSKVIFIRAEVVSTETRISRLEKRIEQLENEYSKL